MPLPLTELKSVFLSSPSIGSKLDRCGLTEQYATLFPSTAHQMLNVPPRHVVGSRLNDPHLFNQSLRLCSPSPLIVLCCLPFVVSGALNPFALVLPTLNPVSQIWPEQWMAEQNQTPSQAQHVSLRSRKYPSLSDASSRFLNRTVSTRDFQHRGHSPGITGLNAFTVNSSFPIFAHEPLCLLVTYCMYL